MGTPPSAVTLRERIGGRWAITWVTYVVLLVATPIATVAYDGLADPGAFVVVVASSAAAACVVLLLADLTVMRNRRAHPVALALVVGERIQLSRPGRYTLIYVDSAGKRVPLAKGTRIASRKLKKTFYAPVMRVQGPDSLKVSAVLARPGSKAITLRVILRNPDGTLEGEDIRLR